jgi:hypothetical protein
MKQHLVYIRISIHGRRTALLKEPYSKQKQHRSSIENNIHSLNSIHGSRTVHVEETKRQAEIVAEKY